MGDGDLEGEGDVDGEEGDKSFRQSPFCLATKAEMAVSDSSLNFVEPSVPGVNFAFMMPFVPSSAPSKCPSSCAKIARSGCSHHA